jgi:putative oxidoreductase
LHCESGHGPVNAMIKRSQVLVWTCAVVLALAFVSIGISKLEGASSIRWTDRFSRWGYPPGTASAIGMLEILGGLGVLFPKWRRAAALILVALMIGALCTHLLNAEFSRVVPPLVLGCLALLVSSHRERSSTPRPTRPPRGVRPP